MKKFILTATILLAGAANAESFNCNQVLGQSFCEDADQKLAYKFSINEEQKNVALLKYDDQNELVDKVNLKNCNLINNNNWSCEYHVKGRKLHKSNFYANKKIVIEMSEGTRLASYMK
jgi:hypothetical protein